MAYAAGEYLINVRGHLSSTEIWSNTWCVIDPTGTNDIQDAADAIHGFYEDIGGFASWLSTTWGADSATATSLFTGLTQNLTFAPEVGSSSAERLPNQLAVRVSLKSAFANGGCFLTGFVVTAMGSLGEVDPSLIGDFVTALETMTAALTSAGWQLGLNQPTIVTATQVTGGRVGNRWDVIRKRANDLAELYTPFAVA